MLIEKEGDSHYAYIKDFIRFLHNKTKHKEKNHFYMNCLQCFSCKEILTNYGEVCLETNRKLATKMSKNALKHSLLIITHSCSFLFLIYVDIETNLKEVEKFNRDYSDESYTYKY